MLDVRVRYCWMQMLTPVLCAAGQVRRAGVKTRERVDLEIHQPVSVAIELCAQPRPRRQANGGQRERHRCQLHGLLQSVVRLDADGALQSQATCQSRAINRKQQ